MSERVIHSLVQGSPEWLAHRENYWNASDAPAMMGVSPHKTRSALLHEKATGITPEVDSYTQSLFDDGHRFEALARPLAEEIIGTDLYPVSITFGKLAASLDGLTMAEDIQWEHKTLNDEIRAATCAADLPLYLRVQMEHQFEASGAEKTLFQATRWDAEGNLLEEVHHWYESDPQLRKKIIDAWAQFERDVAAYVPPRIPETPHAEPIKQLPALAMQIRGEVVTSNLSVFKTAAEAFIARIKTDLSTDEDFVNAAETVKFCEDAENRLEAAKSAALAQTASIDELMRTVDHIREQFRQKRLALGKLVDKRKDEIKAEALAERRAKYAEHVKAINDELKVVTINVPAPDWIAAGKNKRTLASLYDALDTALANGKIAADAAARDLRAKLDWYKPHGEAHGFLFRDLQAIIQKPVDDFQLAVTTRIAEHKRQEDAKAEAKRKADEAAAQPEPAVSAPAVAPLSTLGRGGGKAIARPTSTTAPTLRLGQINERLALITLTADGLASLGFSPAATDKNAKLYQEADFSRICEALINHIESVSTSAVVDPF